MKHLLACLAVIAAFSSTAQVDGFQLPYNPDAEPDGYIGVADVLALLPLYGSEFEAALFLDEDSTSMVMEVGAMGVFECLAACDDLPSNWTVANMTDFGHALPNLDNATYLLKDPMMSATNHSGSDSWGSELLMVSKNSSGQINLSTLAHSHMESPIRCLCATHERPKVEYSYCRSPKFSDAGWNGEFFQECCDAKTSSGWYPLPTTTGISGNTYANGSLYGQAFWRWAE